MLIKETSLRYVKSAILTEAFTPGNLHVMISPAGSSKVYYQQFNVSYKECNVRFDF